MKKTTAVLVIGLFVLPLEAWAGPFGLEKGMPLKNLPGPAKQTSTPGFYILPSVPKPHASFETYVVKVGPISGLCWLKGVGKDIDTSSFGFELKSAFNEMKQKLEKTYGTPEVVDRLIPGSIWNEPKDWMMGLRKNERHLVAGWSGESGAILPQELEEVTLLASATRSDEGYISVEYYFANKQACDEEIATQADSAL